ncbi:MAG: hypothetical protein OXL68_09215 [Paracoccaceae bacterium]|nr:hypothetical protein [Paracoccaceae bacterium]
MSRVSATGEARERCHVQPVGNEQGLNSKRSICQIGGMETYQLTRGFLSGPEGLARVSTIAANAGSANRTEIARRGSAANAERCRAC